MTTITLDIDLDDGPLDDLTRRYLLAVLDVNDRKYGKKRDPHDLRAELTDRHTPGPYRAAANALHEIQTLRAAGHGDTVTRALDVARVDDIGPFTETDTADRVLAALDAALMFWPHPPTGIAIDRAYTRHHPTNLDF